MCPLDEGGSHLPELLGSYSENRGLMVIKYYYYEFEENERSNGVW